MDTPRYIIQQTTTTSATIVDTQDQIGYRIDLDPEAAQEYAQFLNDHPEQKNPMIGFPIKQTQ